MKFDSSTSWFYKFPEDSFKIEYSFSNVLDTSDSMSSFTASIYNSNDEDKSASMIRDEVTYSEDVEFVVYGGTAGETYNIKVTGSTSAARTYTYYMTCEVFGDLDFSTKIGTIDTNSYVTLKEANDYIRSKYGHTNTWDTLKANGKRRVLIEAAREIDNFNFIGEKYYSSQALEFPRDDHETVSGNCASPISVGGFRNTSLKSSTYGKYPTDYWNYGTCHVTLGTPLYDVVNINSSDATTGDVTFSENLSATPTTSTQFRIFSPIPKEIKHAQIEQALFILETSSMDDLKNYQTLGAQSITIGEVEVRFGTGGFTKVPLSSKARKLISRFIRRQVRISRA